MDRKKNYILILTIIGLPTTVKLAFIYYNANFNPYALASFCSVNDFIDCDGIAKTAHSQFLGVPLALWGLFLYTFIIFMLVVDKLKNIKFLKFLEVFKNPFDYIAALGIISFVFSMALLGVSLFEIKKLCVLCALTYILNLLIALIAMPCEQHGIKNVIYPFRNSWLDFIDGVKRYTLAFVVCVLCAAAVLTYTTRSYVLAPQAERAKEFKEFAQAKINKYRVNGNVLGAENPEVLVHVYSDYKCPVCYAHNIIIHKLAKEFRNVQIVHHNFPLDMDCNTYLTRPFHKGSCLAARYEIAAEIQGNAWGMNDILFQYKPETEEQILNLAQLAGFDTAKLKQDADSTAVAQKLQAEIEEAYGRKLDGTPATIIDDEIEFGIKIYKEFKAWFVKHGAKM